jgi:hypothetical protein
MRPQGKIMHLGVNLVNLDIGLWIGWAVNIKVLVLQLMDSMKSVLI